MYWKRTLFLLLFIALYSAGAAQYDLYDVKDKTEKLIRKAKFKEAMKELEKNMSDIRNDTVFHELDEWVANLYLMEKDWSKLIYFYENKYIVNNEDTSLMVMARYYKQFPKEKIEFETTPVILRSKLTSSGTSLVKVKVNGKQYTFWLDTGAGFTVLSSTVAAACKVKQPSSQTIATAATGNIIDVGYGLIDTLQAGGLKVYHHPCLILNKKQLEFKVLGIRLLKIDGIIGWNLLQELAVTIDSKNKKVTFEPGKKNPVADNNFFWMNSPMVNVTDSTGNLLTFGLDTGADKTAVYSAYQWVADTTNSYTKEIGLWSAGGSKKFDSRIYRRVVINVSGKKLVMKNLATQPDMMEGSFSPEGVFGNKELKNYVIHFDLRGGVFELR